MPQNCPNIKIRRAIFHNDTTFPQKIKSPKTFIKKVHKIPPDGGFGYFWHIFWPFLAKAVMITFNSTPQKLSLILVYTLV